MALFDRETDPAKEREGVPLDFGDYRVTLARAGGANERYEAELERVTKPYRRAVSTGQMDPKKDRELMISVFAKTIVLKWETRAKALAGFSGEVPQTADGFIRGIDFRGKLVPDNEANIVAVLTALPDVYLDLSEAARSNQLFRLEQREDDAGN